MEKIVVYVALLILVSVGCYYAYNFYFSNDSILERVIQSLDYQLTERKNPISVEVQVKPEWIPMKEQESKEELHIVLKELNSTQITLDHVWHRGSDIYFTFNALPEMNYKGGEFLHNMTVNQDGSYSTNVPPDVFKITNTKGQVIDYGQSGFGPGAMFGFAIDVDEYQKIKDGFTLEYSGVILYEYTKE